MMKSKSEKQRGTGPKNRLRGHFSKDEEMELSKDLVRKFAFKLNHKLINQSPNYRRKLCYELFASVVYMFIKRLIDLKQIKLPDMYILDEDLSKIKYKTENAFVSDMNDENYNSAIGHIFVLSYIKGRLSNIYDRLERERPSDISSSMPKLGDKAPYEISKNRDLREGDMVEMIWMSGEWVVKEYYSDSTKSM